MNKIFIKNIKKIILVFLMFLSFSSVNATNQIVCRDTESYDFTDEGNFWSQNTPYYLTSFNKDYPYNLHIYAEAYDCENYNDFFLTIPWLNFEIPCAGDWNRDYVVFNGGWVNDMPENTDFDLYAEENRNDRWGVWHLVLCFEEITKETEDTEEKQESSFLDSKTWFFEKREDFIFFMQIQLWLWFVAILFVLLLNFTFFKP